MIKHVDAAELRIVVAAVLSVAADVVHVRNLARRSSLEVGSTRQRKGGEGRSNIRNSVWLFGTKTGKDGVTRASIPNRKMKLFYHSYLSGLGRRAKHAGCGRER